MVVPVLPEQVRTARLVVVAAARRLGLDESCLDAIRLSVGEACGRAVRRAAHGSDPDSPGGAEPGARAATHQPVEQTEGAAELRIRMTDDDGLFVVEVREPAAGPDGGRASGETDLAAAVIEAFAPQFSQCLSDGWIVTRMAWPLSSVSSVEPNPPL